MNTRIITSVVIAFLALAVTSCSTTRSYPDNRRDYPGHPYPDGRYPDGRYPYPDGRYPDGRSYPTSRHPQRLPPGHAKKVYGSRSAKVYAPGQRNKNWRDNDRRYDGRSKKYSKKYKGRSGKYDRD